LLLVEQPEPLKVADFPPTYNPNRKKPAASGNQTGLGGNYGSFWSFGFFVVSGREKYTITPLL
jgi:hypothetical protein